MIRIPRIIRLARIPVVQVIRLARFWWHDFIVDVGGDVHFVVLVEGDVLGVVAWFEEGEGDVGAGVGVEGERFGD